MKRHTRLGSAVLGGAAFALVLSACAPGTGGGGASDEPAGEISTDISGVGDVTLTVWDQEVRGGQNEQMEQLNEAFMEKYPNVTIERNSQAFDDLATTLRLALTGDDAPDVVQANNGRNTMGAFVEAGQLRPLDDYADAYGWTDRYAESILQYSSYSDDAKTFGSGNLYGLPQVGEVVGVFYSKSKLDALGLEVPQTWSDFEGALQTAKDAGETPLQLGNVEQWPALHVFGPLQGNFVDAESITNLGLGNAGASWTTPENEEAAATMQQWVEAGYFNEGVNGADYDAAWQALADGNGVFLIGGSWLAADLEDAMGDDVGFFVPSTDEGTYATTGGTGLPFAVTSAADNTDVAAAYIDFITSDEAMQILADTGNLPVNRTAELAPESGVLADVFTVFGEVTENGAVLPYLDYATPTFSDTMGQSLQDLIAGNITPAQFTETLEADYAEFVSSNE
ncbi:ABC transporter substrate-binding protein [Microbacterium sp. Marseille-Q6965]|jgi:raffinose/stachyose/melibiose transport system substrate-binding protein|uniref:ABC transporter substrate-binding protein n=1 Tax=Microbacterium sp. Marseille-Q6965 TaxID=2965072 RepID=UPI0021B78885|nr:extracellular solute-binding protein [Microbacterium sp. Marseille-Q6965]